VPQSCCSPLSLCKRKNGSPRQCQVQHRRLDLEREAKLPWRVDPASAPVGMDDYFGDAQANSAPELPLRHCQDNGMAEERRRG
jgi:hypothetical protein